MMMSGFDETKPTGPSKDALRRMLADAMANTLAIQEGRPLVASKPPAAVLAPKAVKNAPATSGPAPLHVSQTTPAPPKGTIPTADDVARAIVAACRETGASPLNISEGAGAPIIQARHYAIHAIEHCFPGLPARMYDAFVGAPGRRGGFYANSKQTVIQMVTPNRRRATWWREEAYARVIKAIQP